MLKLNTGAGRGRPKGSTKKKKQEKELTAQERFLKLKNELIADLVNKDFDPHTLKTMIRARRNSNSAKEEQRGSKLWMEILIRRGEFREHNKLAAKVTTFGEVKCLEFKDGHQFEVPTSFRMGKGYINKELDISIIPDLDED